MAHILSFPILMETEKTLFDSPDYGDINMSGVFGRADWQYIGPPLRGHRSTTAECDQYSQYPEE